MEILDKTLNQMPHCFSSNYFAKKAKINGLTQLEVNNGVVSSYLSHKCIKDKTSRRMWYKQDISTNNNELQYAINLLKLNGYKVMKPVNDWIEI